MTATPASIVPGRAISTVLVPTDLSAESHKALRYGAALAKKFSAELHVVYVEEIDYAIPGPALLGSNPLASDTEEARSVQEQLRAEIGTSVSPTFHGRTGRAYDQICRFARELNADLVIMATHGRTGFKRLVLGSNAERVVQHSTSPVLIVREHERELLSGAAEIAVGTILVPTDFSASSSKAAAYAVELARQFGARVVLLHSVTVPQFVTTDPRGPHHVGPALEEVQAAAEQQMREFIAAGNLSGVNISTHVCAGAAAEQICEFAQREKMDLIVTSTHGRSGLMHVLIGSVAEHVVRYAQCPVLVMPERERSRPGQS